MEEKPPVPKDRKVLLIANALSVLLCLVGLLWNDYRTAALLNLLLFGPSFLYHYRRRYQPRTEAEKSATVMLG